MSYCTEVKTKRSATWTRNGLRFVDEESARQYGISLMRRWPDMTDFEVVASNEIANCIYPVPSDRYPVPRAREAAKEVLANGGLPAPS